MYHFIEHLSGRYLVIVFDHMMSLHSTGVYQQADSINV